MTDQVKQDHIFDLIPVSVDIAVFRLSDFGLQVLVTQLADRPNDPDFPYPNKWALAGGRVRTDMDPDLEAAAHRTLLRRTGAAVPYLEQVHTFGSETRDPRRWTQTTLYFALVGPSFGWTLKPGDDVKAIEWVSINDARLRALAFDHTMLFKVALQRLRSKMAYSLLPAYLLSEGFTLTELQQVYEQILEAKLDKSAFRKKMAELDGLEETGEVKVGGHRPAKLYRLRPAKIPLLFPKNLV